MPLLAAFFGALIGGIAEFLAGIVGYRVAVFLAISAVFFASWAACAAAVVAVAAGLSVVAPDAFVNACNLLLPSNLGPIVAGTLTVEAIVSSLRLHLKVAKLAAGA